MRTARVRQGRGRPLVAAILAAAISLRASAAGGQEEVVKLGDLVAISNVAIYLGMERATLSSRASSPSSRPLPQRPRCCWL